MTKDLKEDDIKKSISFGRFGEFIDVAYVVVFFLELSYIIGYVLVVDGGL